MSREWQPQEGQYPVEELQIYQPEVIVFSTPEAVDQNVAERIAQQVLLKPDSVLTLATGNTFIGPYQVVNTLYQKRIVNFEGITGFNLDEYVGLPEGDPNTYKSYMDRHFYSKVNVPEGQRFIPRSDAEDPHKEAAEYDAKMAAYGPPDLAIVGIGPELTCHIGFNERGSGINSRTRVVELDPRTIEANGRLFENTSEVPRYAITQGVANILEAREIVLVAKGSGKAAGIERALMGPVNSDAPASFLRTHPHATFILDQAAAMNLQS